MARDLRRARLLTVDGFGPTEFFNPSSCANRYEFRYLVTGVLPPPGTVCQQAVRPFPAPCVMWSVRLKVLRLTRQARADAPEQDRRRAPS